MFCLQTNASIPWTSDSSTPVTWCVADGDWNVTVVGGTNPVVCDVGVDVGVGEDVCVLVKDIG